VIKTEQPLFAEGEDPSLIDASTAPLDAKVNKKLTAGKRSDQFAFLEQQ
jgi:hypothetical protein